MWGAQPLRIVLAVQLGVAGDGDVWVRPVSRIPGFCEGMLVSYGIPGEGIAL